MTPNKIPNVTKGVVVDLDDPAGLGRVKVRIPQLHGPVSPDVLRDYNNYMQNHGDSAGSAYRVSDESLPWCEVCYPYGNTTTPEINQVVLVSFINGSPEQPVILGWLGIEYTTQEDILKVRYVNPYRRPEG